MNLKLAIAMALLFITNCLAAACTDDPTAHIETTPDFTAEQCLVRIHGRSETGAPAVLHADYAELSPSGNDSYRSGYQWRYDSDSSLASAGAIVSDIIDAADCQNVVLNGFSNGAGFVARLLCSGEDFGGRLIGVVIDDPVPDQGTADCEHSPDVNVSIYWTGGLSEAHPGVTCRSLGWTCLGEELAGIETFAERIGVPVKQSPFHEHRWFQDAPEIDEWFGPGSTVVQTAHDGDSALQ